ncbi:c2788779-ab5e-416c-a708-46db2bcb6b8e [Sclerotinia trifoliorum]|uniref:C2788779-ab5e-416c-a708-46db2bcb6b8e n=1 Tax=Sclerotinia trifoliorum TaxID=28548 RepID=A0A8H2ZLW0_9HELO|nr:c2788779-ab5e-416c-a708-46db2bcb6b8e [Sclerotinia trifoliorum]
MLKSTHKPTLPPPLPPGWTEHKAPTGHSYYYNAETKQSTYTRPVPVVMPHPPAPDPTQSFLQYQSVGNSIPSAGTNFNKFVSRDQEQVQGGRGGFQGHRGGRGPHDRARESRPQPNDKPKSRFPIPGCEPWVLVHTRYGRRFVYNTEKNQSFWRIPDKLKDGILKLDQLRIKEKAEALLKERNAGGIPEISGPAQMPGMTKSAADTLVRDGEDSSEYEEVEVTDDEEEDGQENPLKRQRTEELDHDDPVEFNEDDIAYQLAAMGQEYGLDPGEYDDGNMDEWEPGAEGLELTFKDSAALFKDLLNDFGINPYWPWEKLIEDGKIVEDTRYTALTNMKSRRDVWDEWSKEKITQLRELRAKEEKKDPKIPYLTFLQKHATPKLYWPEFKRKYKKEAEMRDASLLDKDRERLYREHINRLKFPQSTLKSDLSTLLKSQSLSTLNNVTLISHLPPEILGDIRYISLEASVRDPLIEAFITTLPPPPESVAVEENEEATKQRLEKERRQKALEERERRVAEERRKQQKALEFGRERLRDGEAEIHRAMNVSKRGLMGHLNEGDVEKQSS